MMRILRPDWAWDNYDNWRRLSEDGHNEFEGCGWFQKDAAWCRQNRRGQRMSVIEDGSVYLSSGHTAY